MSPQASSSYPSIDIDAATLPDVLRRRSVEQADEVAFVFLADGEQDERPLTYGQLDRQARLIATSLLQAGASGSRALLVYESGLDYIAALYGCFYAGVAAVPVYPPDPFRVDRTLPRLRSIVNDAGATWLLATAETLDWARPLFRNVQGLSSSLATDTVVHGTATMVRGTASMVRGTAAGASANELPMLEPAQTALLQYTSGSTGEPRGVTITHANLVANLRSIHAALEREGNVVVLWLPAYHDMGLIGGMFQPVYSGRRLVFMSPLSFMQRPARWLEAISRYRGTITAAPNFAYELCIRKVSSDERESLDLSSLVAALNGAEMVRPETLDHFAETFAKCGFRREAFYPCYGLAEATLMVTGGALDELPVVRSFSAAGLEANRAVAAEGETEGRRLVSCGRPAIGQEVRIVDPDTRQPLQEGQVGEVWVAGESIGQGYRNRSEESDATFGAHLADSDEGPFLRTGDFGFFHQGELFIAGRRKELIIVRGRNHYPHDIEETVWRCDPLLKADGGVAFAIEVAGEEHLAVVQEVMRPRKADPAKLIELIRAQVTEIHGVAPVAVALIPAGTLPKTSSGKKQRRACRDQFLSGSLQLLGEWRDERLLAGSASAETAAAEPRTETEKKIAKIWGEVLG
ncbi:MAG: fatty acyl-AMP ligase, partial [Pirellulales bacterium]